MRPVAAVFSWTALEVVEMPIPALDANGLLPPGVHEASIEEVRELFGQFRETEQRVRLQAALEAFLAEARGTHLVVAVIVDGSFTTGKAQPGDVDIVVVQRPDADTTTEFRPDQYNVLSARKVKQRYSFDVLYATDSPQELG